MKFNYDFLLPSIFNNNLDVYNMERSIFNLILHFFVPFVVAKTVWQEKWIKPFLIMAFTIVIDLDHLLAEPIFDPNRCSIDTHPLHSLPAISFYLACLYSPHLRIASIGLLIHIALDGIDCFFI
tara:strand:+ start:110 stop:481 length:372 start_codon:yes stop_codon:yes gene_type:complete